MIRGQNKKLYLACRVGHNVSHDYMVAVPMTESQPKVEENPAAMFW